MADRLVAADVEGFAVAEIALAGAEEGVAGVIHVHEIAALRAVAVNLNRTVLDCQADEPADESLAVVPNQLARPVDIGEPQRARADAEDVVVDEVVILAGRLV